MYCKNCGKKLLENSIVCLNCGAKNTSVNSNNPKENAVLRQPDQNQSRGFGGGKSKYGWVVGIILIMAFGVWGYYGENSPSTETDSGLTSVGDYYCTDYHAEQADLLLPNVDYSNDIAELDDLWYQIDNMTVDENDQASVDAYNAKLDEYDEKAADLDARIISSEGSIEEHDRKIQAYNDYLEENCGI